MKRVKSNNSESKWKKRRVLSPCIETYKTTVTHLYDEILVNIFAFLPLIARKNARLVCETWNKILTSNPPFYKNEKMVCRGFRTPGEIKTGLIGSKYRLHSVRFQRVDMKNVPISLWRTRGKEIVDLRFEYCILYEATYKKIINYCPNLSILSINDEEENYFIPIKVLEYMIRRKFVHPNLTKIVTQVPSKTWLDKLFLVFPSISMLDITDVRTTANSTGPHSDVENTKELLRTLGSSGLIRNRLSLSYYEYSLHFLHGNVSCTRLQEFTFDYIIDGIPEAVQLLEFISELRFLRKLSVTAQEMDKTEYISHVINNKYLTIDIMDVVLDKCPDLNYLHLVQSDYRHSAPDFGEQELVIKPKLLKKLILSKLRYFSFSCDTMRFVEIAKCKVLENYNLKYLVIDCLFPVNSEEEYLCTLTQIFRGVKFSSLRYIASNLILNSVVTHQKNLVCLNFYNSDNPGEKLEIDYLTKLRKLKYLRILSENPVTLDDDFCLPNLEYLHLDFGVNNRVGYRKLIYAITNGSPKLKYLNVNFSTGRQSKKFWMTECSKLKNLEYLYLNWHYTRNGKRLSEDDIRQFFELCRNLRVFRPPSSSRKPPGFRDREYYYDRSSKKMVGDFEEMHTFQSAESEFYYRVDEPLYEDSDDENE